MNYPSGMTAADWQHLEPEQHYRECPQHEDYQHDCCKEALKYLYAHIEGWQLVINLASTSSSSVDITFCPWCAEELAYQCICDEISKGKKERSLGV